MAVRTAKEEVTNWRTIYALARSKATEEEKKDTWRRYDAYLREEILRYMGARCESCGNEDTRVLQVGRRCKETAKRTGRALYLSILFDYDTEATLLCANCMILDRAGALPEILDGAYA